MENIRDVIEAIQGKETKELIISAVILIAFLVLSTPISKLICKMLKIQNSNANNKMIYRNLRSIFIILGIYSSIVFLQLPFEFINIFNRVIRIILIILISKLFADCVNPEATVLKKMIKDEKRSDSSAKFITKIIRGIIYTIGAFIVITELGYDLSGIVTGLGLSGVVIALAAQDIAKNLFAGFTILTDKTFLVGDYVEIDNIAGNIEDISFRTTRIRTLDNYVVTLPNSLLSDGKVANWSKNYKRRYDFNLRFRLDSDVKLLKEIGNRIKFVLKTNKDIISEDIHVNFTQILEDSINLNVYFYTTIVDYSDFLEFKSEINMIILALLEKEGIKLAYPSYEIIK